MKHSKPIIISLLILLSLCLCTPAPASFDGENLYMSVYNVTTETGDAEFGFDTGLNLDAYDWTQPFTHTVQTTLSEDMFAGTWADLQVGFYTYDRLSATTGFGNAYVASTDIDNQLTGQNYAAFRAETENVMSTYNAADQDNDGVALLPNNLSGDTYDVRMNGTVAPGQYAALSTPPVEDGEANLAVFGDADASNDVITMYLFGYRRTGVALSTGTYLTNGITDDNFLATITLSADGTLNIFNPAPSACPDGDADDDGVCDEEDDCPNTAADAEVDADGCAADQRDSDGDGVPDDVDQCPGAPDTDADGDGVVACIDGCDSNPLKTTPGQCGCSMADIHSDTDGVADCIDTDDDGDGLPDDCENQWGLNPLVANASDGDLDNDGFTDSQECQSGFNPNSEASQPSRPAATAEDQTVPSGGIVTLTATATQGTNPIAAFAWSQTQGGTVTTNQSDDIPNRRSTLTFTAPAVASGQTATLRFDVNVSDSVGIAASPATAVTVTVESAGNNPPFAPGLHAPAIDPESACQVTTATPVLSVNNTTDIDGDDIGIEFSAARDPGFADPLTPAIDVPQSSGNTTAWTYSGDTLEEDTLYYWRARACDDTDCGTYMLPTGFFFVNAVNTPPDAPVLVSPGNGAIVTSLRPIFTTNLTPYTDATDRYDTHTYRLLVSTDSSFASGSLVVDQTYSCAAGGEQDAWQVNPGGNLTEDATYYWRVVYGDDGGGIHTAFSGQTATRSFIVNGSTSAPGTPSGLSPIGGIDVTTQAVSLRFANNGDADSPTLDFVVELATGAAFGDTIVQTLSIADVARDQAELSVQVEALTENQRYYWRVRVTDDEGASWIDSLTAEFRFNAVNEPPGDDFQALEPLDGAVWHALAPTFRVDGVSDPEGAVVYYHFELFTEDNLDDPIAESARATAVTWRLGLGLANNTNYYWRVTAYDGSAEDADAAATPSSLFSFTTSVNFYQPTAPTLNNPYSGGTVRGLKPALSVFRSTDDDGNNISYQFELYPCPNLSCQPVSLGGTVVREYTVEATPVSPLTEDQTYYWRVRALDETDERHASAWMPTASFTVDTDGSAVAFDAQIDLSQIARYSAEETQLFTVTGSDAQDMVGVRVAIPAGAIPAAGGDINLQIGHATRAPALPIGKAAVGAVLFLAPEGFLFEQAVTVRIPVAAPGSDDPAGLQVLTYDVEAREWTPVPGTLVDNGLTMEIRVEHFSLYTLALDDPITPGGEDDNGGGGGGGGGGCFIGSMAE